MFKVPDTKMQDEISSKTAGGLMAFQWGFGFKVSSIFTKFKLPLFWSLNFIGDKEGLCL